MRVTRSSSPRRRPALVAGALLLLLFVANGCSRGASPTVPAPAPATVTSPPPAPPAPATAGAPAPSPADTRFVQQMLGHHAQAIVMTDLVTARSRNETLRMLAERIAISQGDEMALMRRWLQARGLSTAMATDGHALPGMETHGTMPGMLTAAELAALAQATGPEFDRLFLRNMIRHHEGALAMVATLLATPGAAQESGLFRLVSDIDADQRAEIRRMRALLDAIPAAR